MITGYLWPHPIHDLMLDNNLHWKNFKAYTSAIGGFYQNIKKAQKQPSSFLYCNFYIK